MLRCWLLFWFIAATPPVGIFVNPNWWGVTLCLAFMVDVGAERWEKWEELTGTPRKYPENRLPRA